MGANILVVEDDPDTRQLIVSALEGAREGFRVKAVGSIRRAVEALATHEIDCILLDHELPDGKGLKFLHRLRELRIDSPVILVTVHAEPDLIVEATKLGAVHYVVKHGLYLPELVQRVREAIGGRELSQALKGPGRPGHRLPPEVRERYRACGLIGESDAMQSAIAAAESAARCRVPVLLQGETGTGKELFARAIHYRSELADGPFVTVNCPAIPKELLESELFGHVKGAFTGATESRRGLFEIADGGTIFLDEIGEIDTGVQAKLLRALENGEIQPVGTCHTRKVRVRVIAASNRDLRWACEQAVFREDLYYRLNGLRIVLPPLRERRGDVRILFRYFLDLFQREAHKQLGPVDLEALGLMERYSWPGNVRELRNEVQRIVALLEPGERVGPDALSPELRRGQLPAENNEGTLKEIQRRVEAAVIRARLRQYGYNRTAAARSLGVTREWLWFKMRQLGISRRGT